eukprot:SAG22_NODE_28_length_28728_cov_19.603619_15_plen_30_part_00
MIVVSSPYQILLGFRVEGAGGRGGAEVSP